MVQVDTVQFVIATEDGTLVEAGAATPEDGGAWRRYETTVGFDLAHPRPIPSTGSGQAPAGRPRCW
jgi:hypothetical protein